MGPRATGAGTGQAAALATRRANQFYIRFIHRSPDIFENRSSAIISSGVMLLHKFTSSTSQMMSALHMENMGGNALILVFYNVNELL